MTNPIEDFEFLLKKNSSKRHLALYNRNKQLNKQLYRPQDVISCVSDQLKAIQVADNEKNNKSVCRDLPKFQGSAFLSVNKLPVYEEAPKPNTFDTQFVSNTQLINIIEDAELIDKHRGVTQEFETSFSHIDKPNGLGESNTISSDKGNTNKIRTDIKTIDMTHSHHSKELYIEDNVTKYSQYGKDCCNYYIEHDGGTYKIQAEKKFEKNKNVTEKTDTSAPEIDKTSVNNKSKYNIIDNSTNITYLTNVRIAKNIETPVNHYLDHTCKSSDDISKIDEGILKNKNNFAEYEKNCNINRNLINNIGTDGEIYTEKDTEFENTEINNFNGEEMEQDNIIELNECIEIDGTTDNYTERSPSPILINKRVQNKSTNPSPLVFDLDAFEKFENFAISMLEHNDFEKAKHVINSQILGKELHVRNDEDVELKSKDLLSNVLHVIHNSPHKTFEEETVKQDLLTKKHISNHLNKELTTESLQRNRARHPNNAILDSTNENNNLDSKNNPNETIFSVIQNQSPILSQILPDNVKKKAQSKQFNNDEHNTSHSHDLDKCLSPIDKANIILNDEILFSSDEEDIHKEYQDLPFTCALETSFYKQSDVLDESMYVGFQTASNRSIQICKDSFEKARNLLSGVDDDDTTVTDLVKLCDDSNKHIDNTEVKKVINAKENEIMIKKNDRDTEILAESADDDKIIDRNIVHKRGEEIKNISTNEGCKNLFAVKDFTDHKNTVENNNNFDGFKTASNKIISLSDKALARCKKVFQDIDFDEKYDTQTEIDSKVTLMKANFEAGGLNGGNSKITEQDFKDSDINVKFEKLNADDVIMKDDLDDLIHNLNDEVIIQEFENIEMSLEEDKQLDKDGGFVGFKTASDKNIVISNEALAKSKNIFQDIDMDVGIDENKVKSDHKTIHNPVSSTDKTKVNTVGFQAASMKNSIISGRALPVTENIFKDIDFTDVYKLETNTHGSLAETHREQVDNFESIPGLRDADCDKKTNNYDHSFSNRFTGFKTANNKAIQISKEALAKTGNIFQDIDSVQFRVKSYIDKGVNVQKKDVFPNIEDFNQPSTSKATFVGFKTGNNKEIKISNACRDKVKHVFKDIDLKEDHTFKNNFNQASASKPPYPGFKTGNDSKINVSRTGLGQDKPFCNIEPYAKEDTMDYRDIEELDKLSTSKVSFEGFKTANNREIKISKAALSKTKNIFNDIDSINVPRKANISISNKGISVEHLQSIDTNKTSLVGFKTANNEEIRIHDAAFTKTRRIFNDIDDIDNRDIDIDNIDRNEANNLPIRHVSTVNDNILEENAFSKVNIPKEMPEDVIFQGFKTASNKQLKISNDALSKTKHIFKDIDTNDQFNIEAEKLQINSKNIRSSSYRTASDNFVNEPKENESEKSSISTFKGFHTASNKAVTISEEALARSKSIFKDLDAIENMTNTVAREDLNDIKIAKSSTIFKEHDHNTEFKGFQTGNNKVINVSKRAVDDSRKLLEDFSFKSANNKTVKVSENALEESKKILQDKKYLQKQTIEVNVKGNPTVEELRNIIDTQVINNFEETLYTEDFKATPIKSKRSGSPILSCPRAKKRKKFETPYSQKLVKNLIKHKATVGTTNIVKFDDNYKKNKLLTLKDLLQFVDNRAKIDPYITQFSYDELLKFEFNGRRNDLSTTNMTIDKLKEIFLETVNSKLVPDGWIENHLRLIIWKLISYEVRFLKSDIVCSATNVLNQLKYRYDRELFNTERPALRKIFERDDLSTKTIILCVIQIFENGEQVHSVTNPTNNIELLLTDGWYCVKASTDRMLAKLVYDQKIVVGTKIVTNGAELMNCDQGMAPWEDTSSVRLKLFGNSTRRARWDARLGYHGNAAILSCLSTVHIDGGRVSKLRVFVTRVYPSLYVEKFEDGSTVTRSERLEHLHQMKYETERQVIMEKLYEEVEKEFSDQESQDSEGYSDSGGKRTCLDSGTQIAKIMRKCNDPAEFRAQLTSSQSILLTHHTEKRREKLLQDVQARIREKMEKKGMCVTRNVVPVKKIRVVGVEEKGGAVKVTRVMMSIWKPNESILELIKEGIWIDVINVVPTSVRYSEIQLSAGRQSVFSQYKHTKLDKLKSYTALLLRKCFNIKDIVHNPSMSTEYNEIDTVGLVFLIDPSIKEFESTKQLFQNVYITDGDKNIICVNFWGGLKKFGFENVLDTGQIVVCGNLQKRAGNTRKNIPQYRVTEFSYFTKTPKNENARLILEELNKIFSGLDRRKFSEDCLVLKNNYSVIKNCNNENISPYRPNYSDLNRSKNKQFIDSPLIKDNFNLTGLDFESTFKQTDTQDLSKELLLRKKRANEKILKLKMYGEPPPLTPITILNKSINAFNSYKSPLLAVPGSSNERIPYSKLDSFINVASIKNTPQKMVVSNDIGHSPVLDRTYVKSVIPVKLNFDNNDSVIDHFAEEFDGSPPLSLD